MSLAFGDNKFIVITGPNGGGKSTLARLIAGIEKPDSGQVIFNGEDITDLTVTERAGRGISYALQQPVKFKGIRVVDLLRIAAGKNLSVGEACEYLSEVDEPEAGIDLWSFQNLIQVFERMQKKNHGTIIIISHQERILDIADEIVVIADGKIESHGARDEILPGLIGTDSAVDVCNKLSKGE